MEFSNSSPAHKNYRINLFLMILKNFQFLLPFPNEYLMLKENKNIDDKSIPKIDWHFLMNNLRSDQNQVNHKSFWIDFIVCVLLSLSTDRNISQILTIDDSEIIMNMLINDINFQYDFENGQSAFSISFQNNYLEFIQWLNLYFQWQYNQKISSEDKIFLSKLYKSLGLHSNNSIRTNDTILNVVYNMTRQIQWSSN
jgi:hypothetical protein